MADPWQILRDAGLPLATPRTNRLPTVAELGAAVRAAVAQEPTGREADALTAFVFAWRQHWPSSFADVCDDTILHWAERNLRDPDRFLKLRRIALANLATVL